MRVQRAWQVWRRSASTSKDTESKEPKKSKSRLFVAQPGSSALVEREMYVESMTPKNIVEELNRYIIGQENAKRAVAVSLRNRWRRQQLDEQLRKEG